MEHGRMTAPVTTQRTVWGWALVALAAFGLWWGYSAWKQWQTGGNPQTIINSSLQAIQEQNVLVPFTARYVSVVTSSQSPFGVLSFTGDAISFLRGKEMGSQSL